ILFAACGQSGNPPATPSQPMMVILNARNGKFNTTLPLAGSSDGAVFNPRTMEVFSAHGNGTLTVIHRYPFPGYSGLTKAVNDMTLHPPQQDNKRRFHRDRRVHAGIR